MAVLSWLVVPGPEPDSYTPEVCRVSIRATVAIRHSWLSQGVTTGPPDAPRVSFPSHTRALGPMAFSMASWFPAGNVGSLKS